MRSVGFQKHPDHIGTRCCFVVTLWLLCCCTAAWSQQVARGPEVNSAVRFDVSPPLRDMPPAPRPRLSEPEPRLVLPRTAARLAPRQLDPVVQSVWGPIVAIPATSVN